MTPDGDSRTEKMIVILEEEKLYESDTAILEPNSINAGPVSF